VGPALREEAEALLRRHGLEARRSLDQHFLVREGVLRREVEALDARGRTVLEVGVGLGFLTRELASVASRVVGIEKDPALAAVAGEVLAPYGNVELVVADALEAELPPAERAISNVPYGISSPLVFRLIERCPVPTVLVLQREFARRMVARPGSEDYSRLSVMVQHYAEAEVLFDVPRGAFLPAPRVDSAAVRLVPRRLGRDPCLDAVVMALFQHRNQTVRNAVLHGRHILSVEKGDGGRVSAALGALSERHVRDVPVEGFEELSRRLAGAGMGPRAPLSRCAR
jgi:16S rRNA (adenine1518-N6/adenine1519-N6)-dimethyltransferase